MELDRWSDIGQTPVTKATMFAPLFTLLLSARSASDPHGLKMLQAFVNQMLSVRQLRLTDPEARTDGRSRYAFVLGWVGFYTASRQQRATEAKMQSKWT
jgi:hypothetical protein